jgi:hypothetical protein
MIPDRRARDAPPAPSVNLGIYFDEELDRWANQEGAEVCQEHARALPCPYHRRLADSPEPTGEVPEGQRPPGD